MLLRKFARLGVRLDSPVIGVHVATRRVASRPLNDPRLLRVRDRVRDVLAERGLAVSAIAVAFGLEEIRGLKVYTNLAAIDRPVDMVEVFRKPEDLYGIAEEAIAIGARVLWGQIGVVNHDAARLAEEAGLKVVMNRCPKIELFRPFWKPKLHLGI